MAAVPSFPDAVIESLAKVLGECGTGSELGRAIIRRGMQDLSGESTKWRRLYSVFLDVQRRDKSANRIIAFVQDLMNPARFVGKTDDFNFKRIELNTVLAFCGLNLSEDGSFKSVDPASTLSDAQKRARTLQSQLHGRRIHEQVTKYCRAELMQEDYFHAVFEASKGLAQRIREMSGVHIDGAKLIDKVFSIDRPILAINSLRSELEQSDHKGFAALLKGCFAGVRNRLAHEPRLLWDGEHDAADYLSLISLLHRRLDGAVKTGISP
ncbi:MAG: TIGR02391 family protein [Luteolibacter sp.]